MVLFELQTLAAHFLESQAATEAARMAYGKLSKSKLCFTRDF